MDKKGKQTKDHTYIIYFRILQIFDPFNFIIPESYISVLINFHFFIFTTFIQLYNNY